MIVPDNDATNQDPYLVDIKKRWAGAGTRDRCLEKFGLFLLSSPVQVIFLVLVFSECMFIIVDFLFEWSAGMIPMLFVASMLCVDVFTRMWVSGASEYFSDPWNRAIFLTTIISILQGLVAVMDYIIREEHANSLAVLKPIRITSNVMWSIGGGTRLLRVLCILRHWVSMNKRRFVDEEIGVNIDLSYITDHVIAMSVPATGVGALYRNPISEVVRFFEARHKGNYRIYNACPEHPYPFSKFNYQVRCFDIQDHSPPTMENVFDFLDDATSWFSSSSSCIRHGKHHPSNEHVIAIHCRGGKGRTGTFCCAWLLYSGRCPDVASALALFESRRTNLAMRGKMQGVETKSQIRYLRYLDQWLRDKQLYFASAKPPLDRPPSRALQLVSVKLKHLFRQNPNALGSALRLDVRNPSWWRGNGPLVGTITLPLESVVRQWNRTGRTRRTVEFLFEHEVIVEGDFRIDVWAIDLIPTRFQKLVSKCRRLFVSSESQSLVQIDAGPSLTDLLQKSSLETDPSELQKRKGAGSEKGLWLHMHLHTAFLGSGPRYIMKGEELDTSKLERRVFGAAMNREEGEVELLFEEHEG